MPVRIPLITDPAARVLLDGIVDYAGLFPPAALSVGEAVRNYARYRGGEGGWMLSRFVCQVAQFDAFTDVSEPLLPRDVGAIPWRLAAIGSGDHAADASAIARLNESHRWGWDECSAIVDVVETRAPTVDEIPRIHASFGSDAVVYVEVPLSQDPAPFVALLAQTGRRAKLRTGGVTADAFPSADAIIAFMQACLQASVPFKATAGLHHAIAGSYALTYDTGASSARMYGYLNVFLAAALLMVNASPSDVRDVLTDGDATAFRFTPDAVHWRDHAIDRNRLAHLREHVCISFGSCSFTEPVSEIRASGGLVNEELAAAISPEALAATLDPSRRSWVVSANEPDTDFPIQNLPFCVFRRSGDGARVGVAIGKHLVDIPAALEHDVFSGAGKLSARACLAPTLNPLMSLGRLPARVLRVQLSEFLRVGGTGEPLANELAPVVLVSQADVEFLMPAVVGDYTDFYASVHHATNVGRMFRPDNPLLPNYKWVPIGYHGRASSVVVSGTPVHRPSGQRKAPDADAPVVGPSRSLDYEVEVAAWVGPGNPLGTPMSLDDADAHLFGLSLLNDWSARDLQAWEYQPLGPFLAKNFASTVSPFIVTLDALEPFRAPLAPRADGDPAPLPYLTSDNDRTRGGFDVTVEAWLRTAAMREAGDEPVRLSRGRLLDLYWSLGQMLTHHASNGCNMCPGDLLGSGTVSGPEAGSQGCLLELTKRAAEPVTLPNGETRGFLEAGDEVILRGYAERDGAVRIGFGECRGVVG